MEILSYQDYKDSFFAFAGECSKDEYLAALSDYDFLEKFNDYMYGKDGSKEKRESEDWEKLDDVNTKYCEKLYEEIEMAKISLNNGITFKDYNDLDIDDIDKIIADWDNVVSYMDDDTREQTHSDLAPCDNLAFLKRYLELAPEDLIIG